MVSKTFSVVLNNLISVKAAAMHSNFSQQYIRRLLRIDKMAGFKIGQLWLIDKTAYEAYLKNANKTSDRRFGPKNNSKS